MAANAAAPPLRPSRTAETSTSTLWAPGPPLLQRQPDLPQPASVAILDCQQQQQQPTQLRAGISGAQDSGNNSQQEAQFAQHAARHDKQEAQPLASAGDYSMLSSEDNNDSEAALDAEPVRDSTQVPHRAEAPSSEAAVSGQQESKQASHHDAHQPWANIWTQPSLPALTVPAAQSGAGILPGHQQYRRATASDVPATRALQQQAARQSSGQHAARSLSWSQSARDPPVANQHSTGDGSDWKPSMLHCPCQRRDSTG